MPLCWCEGWACLPQVQAQTKSPAAAASGAAAPPHPAASRPLTCGGLHPEAHPACLVSRGRPRLAQALCLRHARILVLVLVLVAAAAFTELREDGRGHGVARAGVWARREPALRAPPPPAGSQLAGTTLGLGGHGGCPPSRVQLAGRSHPCPGEPDEKGCALAPPLPTLALSSTWRAARAEAGPRRDRSAPKMEHSHGAHVAWTGTSCTRVESVSCVAWFVWWAKAARRVGPR
jgi:hypothetical protein